jgi:hypothetical protein
MSKAGLSGFFLELDLKSALFFAGLEVAAKETKDAFRCQCLHFGRFESLKEQPEFGDEIRSIDSVIEKY